VDLLNVKYKFNRKSFIRFLLLLLKETLRTALALGADRAIHVEISGKDYEMLQPLAISKLIAAVAKKENVDLVLLGKLVSFKLIELCLFTRDFHCCTFLDIFLIKNRINK
jgi:hypothetical protein